MCNINPDKDEIFRAARIFNVSTNCIAEIRAIGVRDDEDSRYKYNLSGYYDDPELFARHAASIQFVSAVYFTLNPCNPDLFARSTNKLRIAGKDCPATSDKDIIQRKWLPLDFDPVRPAGISSSDEEHQFALERAEIVAEFLKGIGWPDPIFADSGNGAHLLYPIDKPAEDNGFVKNALERLAAKFDDERVKIDRCVHNPARIWKLYGTVARKGDHTPHRPHRMAKLLKVPNGLESR